MIWVIHKEELLFGGKFKIMTKTVFFSLLCLIIVSWGCSSTILIRFRLLKVK
jgi:hypothetical protein